MPDVSIDEFLQTLEQSQLVSADRLTSLRGQLKSADDSCRSVTAKAIARRLVADGLLTRWQAEMLMSGQTAFVLDRYKVLEPVGRGGMGTVFKAEDVESGAVVAVKVMAGRYTNNEKLVSRFKREIRAAATLDSPHVVRAFDGGNIAKTHFLVMEYVEGENVDEIAARMGRMPLGAACEVIRQAALGLQHAHERGLVHRDIKPSNLMLSWDDSDRPVVKIFDMGLVLLTRDVDDTGVTRPGQVMGTPDYMSPEQGWNTADVDIRTDIFSLGCTLFRLVSGRVPYSGDNPLQVLLARCSSDAPPIRSVVSTVPAEFESVLSKIMARDPDERFQTPVEVAKALQPFCRVPTRKTFANRRQRESNGDSNQATSAGEDQQATQNELTFQQFLKDLRSNDKPAMLSDDGEEFPSLSPPPASSRGRAETHGRASSAGTRRSASRREAKQTRRLPWLPAAGTVVALLIVVGLVSMLPGRSDEGANVATTTGSPVEPTTGTKRNESIESADGQNNVDATTATQQTVSDTPSGTTSNSAESQAGMAGNSEPGNADATELDVRLNDFPVSRVAPGRRIRTRIGVLSTNKPPADLQFRLTDDAPAGAVVDEQSGMFEWTPDESAVGVHRFALELLRSGKDVLDRIPVEITVVATPPLPELATVPDQTVVAGEPLLVTVKPMADSAVPPGSKFETGPGSPDGLAIDGASGLLTWTPAKDVRGTFEVAVRLTGQSSNAPAGPDEAAVTRFRITVKPPMPTTNTDTVAGVAKIPDEAEQKVAEEQIREVLRRDFAQARSTAARRALAMKLLVRAKQQQSLAGPALYVLLRLAREYALRARDYETALEAVRLTAELFGEDSIQLAIDCFETFRVKGVTPVDLIIAEEHALRLARDAVEQDRFVNAAQLLAVPRATARQTKNTELIQNVVAMTELADKLKTDDGSKPIRSAEVSLAKTELLDALSGWMFQPILEGPDSLAFVNHSDRELADKGRSLWQVNDGRATISAPNQNALTGFLDRSRRFERFTLRARISGDSTTGLIYFGAPVSGRFNGFQLQLSPQDFCQIKRNGTNQPVARPFGSIPRNPDGWDHLELRVNGPDVAVLVNGVRILEAQLTDTTAGYIGLDAYLGFGNPTAQLKLEDVRVRE